MLVRTPELRVVAQFSPHPDDEAIGPSATHIRNVDAGRRVVNYAASLGRPDDHARRRAETQEGCNRMGFEATFPEPAKISGSDDLVAGEAFLTDGISEFLEDCQPQLIVSPSLEDNHHGHEVVARAVRNSIVKTEQDGIRWWMYKTWGHLIAPTLYSPFDQEIMDRVMHGLDAHIGENTRNDYKKMVHGDGDSSVTRGAETIFPFGSKRLSDEPYAELFVEVIYQDGEWFEGERRVLDIDKPFTAKTASDAETAWRREWLFRTSEYEERRDFIANYDKG